MIGQRRIFGHFGGRFHFAQVELEILESKSVSITEIEISIRDEEEIGTIWDDWQIAVRAGVERFIAEYLDESCGKTFTVFRILASNVDTENNTLECASYLAAYDALFTDKPSPEISYSGRWHINFHP